MLIRRRWARTCPTRSRSGMAGLGTRREGGGGPSDAAGVVLVDTLPVGASFVSADGDAGCAAAGGGSVSCLLGVVAAGETRVVGIVVAAPSSAGELSNLVQVRADAPGDPD